LRELLRTNDAVLLARVTAMLEGAGIATHVFDQHLSAAFAGLLDTIQQRLMVDDDDYAQARRILRETGETPADG
jgi:Putative prokaryotic signal transducing protein